METISIMKVLSNETRFKILEWLKNSEEHFGPQHPLPKNSGFEGGICVGAISDKTGLAQSVISGYLVKMQKAGLLETKRYGQWTYYRRDESNIARFKDRVRDEL
ncbi:transcriptional regulator [Paenibacillus psychroresistens]|uniref:Transcriptional regulator n=1 Tax=Paenibacillus psychroresistens TaxID=1778678 RepID=A0A6B8RQH2_9BACL|nr:metalloregulator ArsR/SmtB family transcription factor [Paenibacillus psychroresistens]QGQ97636.1 transcriptional regulator [Paenibacillus psychroresistens]